MTITHRFEIIADRFQNKIALIYQDKKISYKDLNDISNKIARFLIKNGVNPEDRIGLYFNESIEMITGIFGVLKSGASYIPMPESFPIERINDIIQDAKIRFLLTLSELNIKENEIHPEAKLILLDKIDLSQFEKHNLKIEQNDENCVYSIYTSGSTGKPKGVSISHKNLINLTIDIIKRCQLNENDCGTKYAGYGFDASILEIFPILLSGGCIHIIDKETKLNLSKIKKYFDSNQITYCFFPTQFSEIFMHEFPYQSSLRFMIVGGDKLKKVTKTKYKILNMYGPTETTVASTVFEVDKTDYKNIPIGKPLDNYKIYIVDHHMNLCPVGVAGELCIAGLGVGLGYINLPQITKEKFIPNPFVTSEDILENKNAMLYRSGDLAKWLPCGNIEFLGRLDFQVKIRGFRIELEEIEHKLSLIPQIDDSIVVALKDDRGEDFLCAYYTSQNEINLDFFKNEMSKGLPDYMIPSAFCWIPQFPINANGKIDRKKLPKPELKKEDYVAPRNKAERVICEAMEDILGQGKISVKSNFFHVGGNSLKAVLVSSRLQDHFFVSVSDIFQYKSIENIALKISEKKNTIQILKQNQDRYPLTASQKGIYFASMLDSKSTIYNLPMAIEIQGDLNRDALGQSIDCVIEKHRILKSRLILENHDIYQIYCPDLIISKDFQKTRSQELASLFSEFVRPFDFFKGPLMRIKLIQTDVQNYVLFMDIHHIISDGASQNLFVNDLFHFYQLLSSNASKKTDLIFKNQDIDFFDYSVFESDETQNSLKKSSLEYWKNQDLSFEKVHIPMDFPESQFSDAGHSLEIQIQDSLIKDINVLSIDLGVTKYTIFLASYLILISKYARSDHVTVGGFFSGRSLNCIQNMFGMFVSTLPVSVHLSSQMEMHVLLGDLHKKISQLIEHQHVSLTELMEISNLSNINGRNPFFNNAFNFVELSEYSNAQLKTHYLNIAEHKKAHFDLTLNCFQIENQIKMVFEYSTNSYRTETITTAINSYLEILKSIVYGNKNLCDIPFATDQDRILILEKFNKTDSPVNETQTVMQWFEETVLKFKNQKALVFQDKFITYEQLNQIANQIGNHLKKCGVEKNQRVGIFVSESLEMITGILGILKCGACYVPLADSFPLDRINLIIEDAEIKVLLTQKDLCPNPDHFPSHPTLICLDELNLQGMDDNNPSVMQKAHDAVYSIYTSGSTGKPKGVSICQRNLIYFVSDIIKRCGLHAQSQCSKYMGYAFDASVMEIFPCLLSGGCLHILDKKTKMSLIELKHYFENNRITFCVIPTQFAEIFTQEIQDNKTLTCMIIGGDKLRKVSPHRYKIFNMYGPTETTVAATAFEVEDGEEYKNIPIGKPMDNYRAYIVDQNMNLCPIGVTGELCIAGCGVGLGYINIPKVTNERFIENPFVTSQDLSQNHFTKMYRTGDLARWRTDGNIEFIGRIDFQVKINGFRIELGEIENKILDISGISDCIVLSLKDRTGSDYLCAYCISKNQINEEHLRSELSKSLPEYMIPAVFLQMESFPINANGKVDRKKLPLPVMKEQDFCTPQNQKETRVAHYMAEVLGLEQISATANFFHMGGNSLKAVLLVSKLQNEFEISISDIFTFKTVKSIAEHIQEHKSGFSLDKRFQEIKERFDQSQSQNPNAQAYLREYRAKYKKYEDMKPLKKSNLFPLVTGGTGYLGCHIVLEWLEQTDYPIAVLVRGNDLPASRSRLFETLEHYGSKELSASIKERIHVVQGDITEPHFYLGDRDYEFLMRNVTCVINAAANVKHFGQMETFYKDNVESVKRLISFCKETQCQLHHISTYSVSTSEVPIEIDPIFTEFHMRDSNLLTNPYLKTKMQAEEEIEFAIRTENLKANIYRVGNLVFNTKTNLHQINIENNGFYQILKCILNLGFSCKKDELDYVELSPVNETARAIVILIQQENLINETFHVYNQNQYRISDLFSYELKKLNLDSFLDKIKSYSKNQFSHDIINNYMLHSGWLNLKKDQKNVPLFNEKTELILNKLDFHWSKITASHFRDMIDQSLKERYQYFQENPEISSLGIEFIKDLSLHCKLYILKENDIVLSPKSKRKSLYFILDGFAQMSIISEPGGWTSSIGVLSQYDLIGIENTVNFENKNIVFDSILGDLVLLELEDDDFRRLKKKHGQFFDALFVYALKRLHVSNLLISNFA